MRSLQENQANPANQANQADAGVVLIEGQASLTANPAQVHIGQPVVWTLSVKHGRSDGLGETVKAPVREKEAWVLTDGPRTTQVDLPDGTVRTDVGWTYLSLRPGNRTPADYALTLKRGAPLHVEVGSLEVLGELEEGEDAPRPMAPVLPIEASHSGHGGIWIGLGLLALLVFVVWRMTRGGRDQAPVLHSKGPFDELKAAQLPGEPAAVRQALFDWHRDLRGGIDHKLGADLAALMDGAWLEQSQELAGAGDLPWTEVEELLQELERLKYQEPLPSRLTLSGMAERVAALAIRLDSDSAHTDGGVRA